MRQLVRKGQAGSRRESKTLALKGSPLRRVHVAVFTPPPGEEAELGTAWVARVRLSSGVSTARPGEGLALCRHSIVLVLALAAMSGSAGCSLPHRFSGALDCEV